MTDLYEISSQYMRLAEFLADGDFDLMTIEDTIESSGLVDSFNDKAQALEFVARGATAHHMAIDVEIARLQALKARREAIAVGVRKYLMDNMIKTGISKITCPLFTISLAMNPPATVIHDPLSLPPEYMKFPEPKPPVAAPDKAAIKKAIQSGVDVPGASLTQTQRLSIK